MRTLSTLLAAGATAVALSTSAPTALAAPSTGSSGSSSGSSNGSSDPGCGPRSNADLRFLRAARQTEFSCSVQDSAIGLAQSQCKWLDTYGNSAHNHIVLAERSRGAVKYPYTFLDAAISAYCPRHTI
ncbi:DUF732 domain-containing protein [Nocardia tengchongensis]|uniref:DUF732 domain-containing protein n=1 Tax=Nocardia tengchongensis TaxID=2055889 RepID=UPI0036940624